MICRKLKSDLQSPGQEKRQPVFTREMGKLLGASLLILWLRADCELWVGGMRIVEKLPGMLQGWEMTSLGSFVLFCLWLKMASCGDFKNKI